MFTRRTVVRSLHDVGVGIWLGGSLMGALALNGAASDVSNPRERAALAADGWSRWSPVNAAAVGAHLVGGVGLVLLDRGRADRRSGAGTVAALKAVATGLAVATTAYSGALGAKVAAAGYVPSDAATTPGSETPEKVAAAQDRLRRLQWATPLLTGLVMVLGSLQNEPEPPTSRWSGLLRTNAGRSRARARG